MRWWAGRRVRRARTGRGIDAFIGARILVDRFLLWQPEGVRQLHLAYHMRDPFWGESKARDRVDEGAIRAFLTLPGGG